MVVEADDVRSGEPAAAIADLQRAGGRQPRTASQGAEVDYSDDGTVALISIPTEGNGNDAESTAALNEIRNDIIPATIGAVDGVTVNVSGRRRRSRRTSATWSRTACR